MRARDDGLDFFSSVLTVRYAYCIYYSRDKQQVSHHFVTKHEHFTDQAPGIIITNGDPSGEAPTK